MSLPVVWMPEAHADLKDARAWYDNIRPELGERFAFAVDFVIGSVIENPLQFPVVHRTLRRAGIRRFPYGLFFKAEESRIVVIACFHGRRNPKHWQDRL